MTIRAQLRLAFRAIMTFTSHFPSTLHQSVCPGHSRRGGAGRALLTPPSRLDIPLNLQPGPRSIPTPAAPAPFPPAPRCGCRCSKETSNTCEPPPNHQHLSFQRPNVPCGLGHPFSRQNEREQRSDRRLHLDAPRANHNPQVASKPGNWSAPTLGSGHTHPASALALSSMSRHPCSPARPDPALGGRQASAGRIGSRSVVEKFTGGCEREPPSGRYVCSPSTVKPGPGGSQLSLGSKG
jgi:hypothetical protein